MVVHDSMCGHLLQHQENPTLHHLMILPFAHAPIQLLLTVHQRLLETTTFVKLEPPCCAAQRECFMLTIHYSMVKVVERQALAARTTLLHGSADRYLSLLLTT